MHRFTKVCRHITIYCLWDYFTVNSYRSAEQGLTLIKDMSAMNTRPALVEHMSHKHEYIMKRFISEIGVVEHEFLKYRKSPPLTRNQPLFIGAIYWQRHLFEHLKKSVLVFKRMENDPAMKASYLMRTAFSQYFSLANDMNEYEKQQLADFLAKGTFVVNNIIKRNILKLNICGSPVGKRIKCW